MNKPFTNTILRYLTTHIATAGDIKSHFEDYATLRDIKGFIKKCQIPTSKSGLIEVSLSNGETAYTINTISISNGRVVSYISDDGTTVNNGYK